MCGDFHLLSRKSCNVYFAVRAFHHVTAAKLRVLWWVLKWNLRISTREALHNTVLVLRIGLLQVALRSVRLLYLYDLCLV